MNDVGKDDGSADAPEPVERGTVDFAGILLERNRRWVQEHLGRDPAFFSRLSERQEPLALFLGCADSRVPETAVLGFEPGQACVHRNVANQAPPEDTNFQAVLEFTLNTLKVPHVLVLGHTRCGGVRAALAGVQGGALGRWLEPLQELARRHSEELRNLPAGSPREDRLAELNVLAQVERIRASEPYRRAWAEGRPPRIHGWILELETGRVRQV